VIISMLSSFYCPSSLNFIYIPIFAIVNIYLLDDHFFL
jgi:hypothetical protein